eukprot:scaffold9044_cov120-Isochrysis_galbana.AAC.4
MLPPRAELRAADEERTRVSKELSGSSQRSRQQTQNKNNTVNPTALPSPQEKSTLSERDREPVPTARKFRPEHSWIVPTSAINSVPTTVTTRKRITEIRSRVFEARQGGVGAVVRVLMAPPLRLPVAATVLVIIAHVGAYP